MQLVAISGPKNVSIFRAHPFPMALAMDVARIKINYVLRNINNRYINTLIKKKIKFSSYKMKFRKGAVAKSYMTKGLLIYD